MGNTKVFRCSVIPGHSCECGSMERTLDQGHVFSISNNVSLCQSLLRTVVLSCTTLGFGLYGL